MEQQEASHGTIVDDNMIPFSPITLLQGRNCDNTIDRINYTRFVKARHSVDYRIRESASQLQEKKSVEVDRVKETDMTEIMSSNDSSI